MVGMERLAQDMLQIHELYVEVRLPYIKLHGTPDTEHAAVHVFK